MKEMHYHLIIIITLLSLIIVRGVLSYFNVDWSRAVDLIVIAVLFFDCGVLWSKNILNLE